MRPFDGVLEEEDRDMVRDPREDSTETGGEGLQSVNAWCVSVALWLGSGAIEESDGH